VIRSCCWRTRLASSERRALASDNGTAVAAMVIVRIIDPNGLTLDQSSVCRHKARSERAPAGTRAVAVKWSEGRSLRKGRNDGQDNHGRGGLPGRVHCRRHDEVGPLFAALKLGLIDQVVVNQVPVVFGSGRPFFATGALAEPLQLENPTTIVRGDRVTHVVYDVSH
jgi:hypothetical protein